MMKRIALLALCTLPTTVHAQVEPRRAAPDQVEALQKRVQELEGTIKLLAAAIQANDARTTNILLPLAKSYYGHSHFYYWQSGGKAEASGYPETTRPSQFCSPLATCKYPPAVEQLIK